MGLRSEHQHQHILAIFEIVNSNVNSYVILQANGTW